MGGLWVDYDLMTTIPGLYAIGEANFSDHGANRLGASALMQGLADGYFILPYTIGDYLSRHMNERVTTDAPEFDEAERAVSSRISALIDVGGSRSVDSFHRELGRLLWDHCGMERSDSGLKTAIDGIRDLRERYWRDVRVLGEPDALNQTIERAGRVADYFELAELMCHDALHRTESCGGHFRVESQTKDGEALRDDGHFSYVAAWEHAAGGPKLHREPLTFENVTMAQRSYQ
jgi:succinate dehydrogenase / fumarate reductase flavoprotein subunit